MISDVTDLKIYKASLDLLKEIVVFVRAFPQSEYDLVKQLKRAAQSIPANIAEGFAKKRSEKEFKRFLAIALGSSDEVVSHLRVVKIIVPKLTTPAKDIAIKYKQLSSQINKLISVWKKY